MSVASTKHRWSAEDLQTFEALQQGLAEENRRLADMNVAVRELDMERERQLSKVAELSRDLKHLERELDHKHYAKGARSW